MLITDYFREIREAIAACDIVHSSNVAYDQRTDYVGFIRGEVYLSTFPHHRHNGHTGQVTTSPAPNLAAVLNEIRSLLPRDLIAASDG